MPTVIVTAAGESATVSWVDELERHALSTDGTLVGQIHPSDRTLVGNQIVDSGQVLSGATVQGYVTVKSGGILEDSLVVGAGPGRHLVQVEPGGIMRDTTIKPTDTSWHVEGARLSGAAGQTAGLIERCDIWGVGDCIGLTGGNNGRVLRNWLHAQVLLSPDPGRGNTDTSHDDLIQIHGGIGWEIAYNDMEAYFAYGPINTPFSENPTTGVVAGNPQYPKTNSMSGIMVTAIKNDGQYPRDLKIHHNYGAGGVVFINAGALGSGSGQPAGYTLGSINDNLFKGDQVFNGHDKTAIYLSNALPVTVLRNLYTDGTAATRRQS